MAIGATSLLGSTGTNHIVTPVMRTTTSAVTAPVTPASTPMAASGVSYVSTIPAVSTAPLATVPGNVTTLQSATPKATDAPAPVTTIVTTTAPAAIVSAAAATITPAPAPVPTKPATPEKIDTIPNNPDPTQVALAATAAVRSMLAPAPFGPTIIIPDENSLSVIPTPPVAALSSVIADPGPAPQPPAKEAIDSDMPPAASTTTTTTAGQQAVASQPPSAKVSLYQLFQTTIAAARDAQPFIQETNTATIGATLAAGAVQRSISAGISIAASSPPDSSTGPQGDDPTPRARSTSERAKSAA